MTDSVREESNPGSCDPLVPESSVSRFLSENERFARQWFLEHATPDMVSEWLAGRGYCPELEMPDPVASLSDSYARATQSGRNSVTSELFQDMLMCPKKKSPAAHTLSRQELQQHLRSLQEPELLMELIRDIANELDVDTLCHKILVNVSLLTQSDRGSLFLAKGPRGGARHLVAKLFDVTPDSVLQDALDAAGGESRIPPIPFGVGIAGHVALTKENLNIKDAYQDSRFNKEIDARTGYRTVSVMCQPILNFRGDVIGVAQCINKVAGGQHFTEQDQEVFRKYLTFCGIGVQNAQLFEMSVREFKRNQLLLSLAKSIFEESSSLERLIGRIMVKAEGLLQCEKCRVYLVDTEQHDEQIFYQRLDSSCDEKSSPLPPIFKPKKFSKPQDVIFATIFELRRDEQEIRQPSLKDLTGTEAVHVHFARHVAATEQTFNWSGTNEEIKSARSNNLSAVPNDIPAEKLGHRVLSIPIFNSDNKVIGVAQLVNKLKGQVFTECDISTLEAFSIFCGLGIYNTQMYENASKLMAKQKVALEVLSYHASSSLEETKRLMQISIPSAEKFKLYSFEFSDFRLSDDDTCQAAIRMFMDLDLIHKFHIPYQVMCRWILSVKKNYRPVIYHNWRHALNVTQTVFAMLMTGHMKEMMSDIEMMALLVACLSHDLDHRGTNNSFQTKIESPLAILYSTSTMEHHHFDQCIMILNSEGNNIFQFLSPEEYRSIISIVESAILSTDLALYFKKKDPFLRLLKSGQPDWKNPLHKELLRGMMMTACDVSAICKPWEVQKKVAELVAGEFFQQGDLEKERLKEQPIAMMDREKKDELPAMQVGFIDCVCLPVYEALTVVQPALSPLLHGCLQNRRNWKELVHDQQIERKDGLPPTIRSKRLESNTLNGVVRLQHLSFQTQVVCKASEDRRKKISLEHCRMKRSSKHHQEGVCTVL